MDPQTEWGTEMAPKGTDRAGDGPGNADGPKEHRQSRGRGWTRGGGWTQRAHTDLGMDPGTWMDPKGTHRAGNGPKGHTQSRGWTRRHTQSRGWTQRAHTEPGMDPKGTHRTGDGPKGHTQSRGWTQRAHTEPGTDPQTHTEPGTERRTRTAPGTLQRRGRSPTKGRKGDRGSAPPPPPPPRSPHSAPNPSHRPAPLRGSEPPAAPGGSVFRSGAAARGAVGDRTALLRRSRRAAADAASERPPLPALAVGAAARRGAVGVPRGVLAAEALPAHRARVVLRAERGLSGRPGGTGGGTGWGTGGRRGRRLPAPARARCSRRGRSGCTAAAAPARPPRSPPYTPGTPTPCLQRGAARSDADPPSPPLHPGVAALAEAAPLPGGGREPSERTGGPHSPPPSPPQPPERGHPPTWS